MRFAFFVVSFGLCVSACDRGPYVLYPDGFPHGCPTADAGIPDLTPPKPKCAAALGLTGTPILCVDFEAIGDRVLGSTNPAPLDAWDFDRAAKGCWQIKSGKLGVVNFGGFADTCSFKMPNTDLAAPLNAGFSSVTLAVVQRVDLNDKPAQFQSAQIMLGLDDSNRRFEYRTGSNPRQQNVNTLTRADLAGIPGVGTNVQPLFKLTSAAAAGSSYSGWEIESIAVMGNP